MQAHRTPAQSSRFESVDAFIQYLHDHEVDTVVVQNNQLLMFNQKQQQEWNSVSDRLLRVYWEDSVFKLLKVDRDKIAVYFSEKAGDKADRAVDQ